jgi:hypothetical protein
MTRRSLHRHYQNVPLAGCKPFLEVTVCVNKRASSAVPQRLRCDAQIFETGGELPLRVPILLKGGLNDAKVLNGVPASAGKAELCRQDRRKRNMTDEEPDANQSPAKQYATAQERSLLMSG